jgi:isopentenyl diphosphate isomerase/L-lactate dehydrogenase-like FMN-dependent dehydrogenase
MSPFQADYTGFTIPFRLNVQGLIQFATKPKWAIEYVTHEKFRLPQLESHVDLGGGATSIGDHFTKMLDQSMNWRDVAETVKQWDDKFCLNAHSCFLPLYRPEVMGFFLSARQQEKVLKCNSSVAD